MNQELLLKEAALRMGKAPGVTGGDAGAGNVPPVPQGIDPEILMKLLGNPQMQQAAGARVAI